jgi:hypothetical protein
MMPAPPPAVPKGSLCVACVRRHRDCSDLNFDTMPSLVTRDGVRFVRCTYFVRDESGRDRK